MSDVYVPTLSLNETVARFRNAGISTSETKMAAGIEQGTYPFGICIKLAGSHNRCFEIYAKQVDEYLAERAVSKEHT